VRPKRVCKSLFCRLCISLNAGLDRYLRWSSNPEQHWIGHEPSSGDLVDHEERHKCKTLCESARLTSASPFGTEGCHAGSTCRRAPWRCRSSPDRRTK
jgi:hypothetical protein